MISVLYRLTNLSFKSDPLQEAIRIGLLAFSSMTFMQPNFPKQPYHHLLNLYTNALFRLYKSTDINVPDSIVFWLTMLSHIITGKKPSSVDWRSVWLDKLILHADIYSWSQAREILRSVA